MGNLKSVMTYFDDRPRSESPDWKTRFSDSLNTEWPKLSASTTRPPVLSTAVLSSAMPTWRIKNKEENLYFQIQVVNYTKQSNHQNVHYKQYTN